MYVLEDRDIFLISVAFTKRNSSNASYIHFFIWRLARETNDGTNSTQHNTNGHWSAKQYKRTKTYERILEKDSSMVLWIERNILT